MPDHENVYHSVKTVENYAEIHLEVQRFIEASFENPKLTQADFVQAKGISQRQTTRALSWHSTTWSRMLLDERMKRSKELLRHSGESIEAIAGRVGYTPTQFTRTFTAEEGMAPEDYRQ